MICSIDYANKVVKRLQSKHDEILSHERSVMQYSYYTSEAETPIIPEYDFVGTQNKLDEINSMIMTIKHDIRTANMKGILKNNPEMTIDEAILYLAFLNKKKGKLKNMANMSSEQSFTRGGAQGSEVHKANFDIKEAKKVYNQVCNQIISIQDELNTYNILTQIKIPDEVEQLLSDED